MADSLSLLQGDLPDPGIELWSLALQVGSLPAELPGKPTTLPIPLPKNCREQKEKQIKIPITGASLWLSGQVSACQCKRHRFNPGSGKIPHASELLSLCTTTIESVLRAQEPHY